jgi:hypothetical protein
VFFLSTAPLVGQDGNEFRERLAEAQSIRCQLDKGAQANWESGGAMIEETSYGDGGTFVFDSIDLGAGTARLIGNVDEVTVNVFSTPAGLTFMELTPSGNVTFTTVFATPPVTGDPRFIAVESRHNLLFTEAIPSQYHGTCEIME